MSTFIALNLNQLTDFTAKLNINKVDNLKSSNIARSYQGRPSGGEKAIADRLLHIGNSSVFLKEVIDISHCIHCQQGHSKS